MSADSLEDLIDRIRLVVTRNGNNYSADEYSTWLGQAGFQEVHHVLLPGSTGLRVGSKCSS
jgi:hypothetical protein